MYRQLRFGLIAGLSLLSATAMAQPNETASFRPLFPRPGDLSRKVAVDNIGQCAPSVRRSIKRAQKKWGESHYSCIDGVVRVVFVYPTSPINKDPELFIAENLGLFDLKGFAISVRFTGNQGQQYLHGQLIPGASIYRVPLKGSIPGQIPNIPGVYPKREPISSRDLQRAPGVVEEREYVVFEIELRDPDDVTHLMRREQGKHRDGQEK